MAFSSVRIEINSVFVSGHRNRLDIRVGIEVDLISLMRPKLTWFWCGYRIYIFVQGVDYNFSVRGRIIFWLPCMDRE